MKKLVLLFTLLLNAINVVAQDKDSLMIKSLVASVDSLSKKLEKLQSDYDYMSLSSDIEQTKNDLEILSNSIDLSSNSLLIKSYHERFNVVYYNAYSDKYVADHNLLNSYRNIVGTLKSRISYTILVSNFSEPQINYINIGLDLLDAGLAKVESALKHYKSVLDLYITK